MRKRYKMSRGSSKGKFVRGAMRVNRRNVDGPGFVMRGGIRL